MSLKNAGGFLKLGFSRNHHFINFKKMGNLFDFSLLKTIIDIWAGY